MIRRQPRSTRTETLFPYPTLFRSKLFQTLLPSGALPADVVELPRFLTGLALDLRIKLALRADQVPRIALGARGDDAPRLGWNTDRKSTRLNFSPYCATRMPSSA